jgi:hypothetical protein
VTVDNGRVRVTVESIGDADLGTDRNWRVSFINPIAEKLTRWSSDDAAAPVHDRSGKLAGMVGVFHDVRGARVHTLAQRTPRFGPCLRHPDAVTRQGGDELVVLPSEITNGEDATVLAEKIRLALMEPSVDSHYLHVIASLGINVYPDDGEGTFALPQYADTAIRDAKEKRRNDSQFFEDDVRPRAG